MKKHLPIILAVIFSIFLGAILFSTQKTKMEKINEQTEQIESEVKQEK